MSLDFGFDIPQYDKKLRNTEALLSTTTARGLLRISPIVGQTLGVKVGDYAMLVNNIAKVNESIEKGLPELIEVWEENSLEPFSEEAIKFTHKKFDKWGIAKGIQLFESNGDAIQCFETLSTHERIAYATENYTLMYENAMKNGDDDLIEAITREGIDKQEIIRIFAATVKGETRNKYAGGRLTTTSRGSSLENVTLAFCDTGAWSIFRKGVDKKHNRAFHIDLKNPVTLTIFDGYKTVPVKAYMFIDSFLKPINESKAVRRKEEVLSA